MILSTALLYAFSCKKKRAKRTLRFLFRRSWDQNQVGAFVNPTLVRTSFLWWLERKEAKERAANP